MDGDMEYRPDHMQHPDGCVTADLTGLRYGDIHHRRRFLHYCTHCVSYAVLANIRLGAGSEADLFFEQGNDAGTEYQPYVQLYHFQLYITCSYSRVINFIAGSQPVTAHGPVLAGQGRSANNILQAAPLGFVGISFAVSLRLFALCHTRV